MTHAWLAFLCLTSAYSVQTGSPVRREPDSLGIDSHGIAYASTNHMAIVSDGSLLRSERRDAKKEEEVEQETDEEDEEAPEDVVGEGDDLVEERDQVGGAGREAGSCRRRRGAGSCSQRRRSARRRRTATSPPSTVATTTAAPVVTAGPVTAAPQVYTLKQSDFSQGTKRLSAPGRYVLESDILFEPDPVFPPIDSTTHKQGEGYFLGFFAAIAIEGRDIELDCQNKKIEMSPNFHKRQRFFSIIELGSRPFVPNAGPPPLAKPSMTPGTLVPAVNVKITNCELGLSSHHGIHGNNVEGITVTNTNIKEFEVAGIALNNATNVQIKTVKVGPSLKETFPASLSQAIFLNHMTNVVGGADDKLSPFFDTVTFKLRGEDYTAKQAFEKLRIELDKYLNSGNGELEELIGKKQIPDGSAIYGILLHKSGPAVGDFGACPLQEFLTDNELYQSTVLEDITIDNLVVAPEAWIALKQNCKQIQGPAGAVFRATKLMGKKKEYVGNALSDAMVAVGHVLAKADLPGTDAAVTQRAKQYYSAAHMPSMILSWASQEDAPLDLKEFEFTCNGDAMSHINKGAIGLRIAYQQSPVLKNIRITNLVNAGGPMEDESLCHVKDYKGNDVKGMQITNSKGVFFDAAGLTPGYNGNTIDIMDQFT